MFVCVTEVSKAGAASSSAYTSGHEKSQSYFLLAYNYNAAMGQAAVIKINSQDFSSLRQGHTLPSGEEEEEEKQGEVGLHGWAEPNREICKEVRCHLILINLHLGGLAPP